MGFFKALAYVAGGIGAVVLAPATGGGTLAAAIGAMGTTTAAGAALGASVGATAAAIDHSVTSGKEKYNQGYQEGKAVGVKAGEAIATKKYEERLKDLEKKQDELLKRLRDYRNFDEKLLAVYAVGLATANADGDICEVERQELDEFAGGIMSSNFPPHIKEMVTRLANNPPDLQCALGFAKSAKLPKGDIDDIIDLIINADGVVKVSEQLFRKKWRDYSPYYEFA